ncbi:hypothetical protein [Streptomyces achromogenes]|uniref:hypothetical protein n=1 Tax=Streptomyces achromogenes TaxID=67255 RepID=UPI0027D8D64B|nr:hypothetical protein [Streptomyces achromogenes]
MYPLVRELAAAAAPHRVPVAVTCRVLNLARQPYYRWRASPVTDSELAEAYRADALFDAHRDDLEFGHRFLLDEARAAGEAMAELRSLGFVSVVVRVGGGVLGLVSGCL